MVSCDCQAANPRLTASIVVIVVAASIVGIIARLSRAVDFASLALVAYVMCELHIRIVWVLNSMQTYYSTSTALYTPIVPLFNPVFKEESTW